MSVGAIFEGRDRCFKDLSSIHGTYRKVAETVPALQLIGEFLHETGAARVLWLLDSPVSNSGMLKTLIYELAVKNNWPWDAELLPDPDKKLTASEEIIASSDGNVLDSCRKWVNLTKIIIEQTIPDAWVINLAAKI